MFRNSAQRGRLSIFFSCGAKPLAIWETHIKNGHIQRLLDPEIKSMVLEIGGLNVSTTYMICPKGKTVLGISMPFLVMVVKNLKKYFTFEVTILDETGTRRRFRASNFQSTTSIQCLCTVMPIGLSDGWNQIQFNLAEFTRRAYQKQFVEVHKVKVNANIRVRRIYFTDRLLPEDQLPPEYKLFFPLASKVKPKTLGEPKTQVAEERKGSKDVVPEVQGKRPSQQKTPETPTAEQIAPPAEQIAPPAEAPVEVPTAEIPPEGEKKEENIGAEDQEIPEGEQKEIGEAVGGEAAGEGEAVPPAEGEEMPPTEVPEKTDVEDSVEPAETPTSMPEGGVTPVTEADAEVNPEAAPDTEAAPAT